MPIANQRAQDYLFERSERFVLSQLELDEITALAANHSG
jgi:hypothetical protein